MGKQAGISSKLGKFDREELVYRHILVPPYKGSAMRKTCSSTALVIGLLLTLIAACPVASRADQATVGTRIESLPPILGRGCPVTHQAHAAECGGSEPEQLMTVGLVMGEADSDYQFSSEQQDSSRTLLENLMRNGLDRNDVRLP
jgi:hypothetical protein